MSMCMLYVYFINLCYFIKVPLGVQLKNEMYLTEMCSVLDSFTKYVPIKESSKSIQINDKSYTYDDTKLIQLMLFGDQLTAARVRGAAQLRSSQTEAKDTLQGFVPVIADWHSKICLVEVCY